MLTRQICNAYGGPRVQAKPLLHDQCCRVPVSGLGIILSPSLNGRPHPVTSSPTGPQGGPRGAPLLPSTAALQDRARLSENTAGRSGRRQQLGELCSLVLSFKGTRGFPEGWFGLILAAGGRRGWGSGEGASHRRIQWERHRCTIGS